MEKNSILYFKDDKSIGYYKLYDEFDDGFFNYIKVNTFDCEVSLDYDTLSSFSDCIAIDEEEFKESTKEVLSAIINVL